MLLRHKIETRNSKFSMRYRKCCVYPIIIIIVYVDNVYIHTQYFSITKANVNGKRVSGHIKADKTCGRAVIIIHYSIILPQYFLYNNLNIACTCQRPDA